MPPSDSIEWLAVILVSVAAGALSYLFADAADDILVVRRRRTAVADRRRSRGVTRR